jgi:hypothetical protein
MLHAPYASVNLVATNTVTIQTQRQGLDNSPTAAMRACRVENE